MTATFGFPPQVNEEIAKRSSRLFQSNRESRDTHEQATKVELDLDQPGVTYCFPASFASRKSFTIGTIMVTRDISVT